MMAWRFLLLTATVAAILYAHFFLAHRAWRRSRGRPSLELDRGYIRMEHYFGWSFRHKVNQWLKPSAPGAPEKREASTSRAGERLRSLEKLDLPGGNAEDAVLVINSPFWCGPACVFARELYVRGACWIGDRSQLQAIAADGSLTLGPSVRVARWVDSEGDLELCADCSIIGRASSRGIIRLHGGARARSLFGRGVRSENCRTASANCSPPEVEQYLPLPLDDASRSALDDKGLEGFNASMLDKLSSDTWMYRGDLLPKVPLKIKTKLIVKGDFVCPPGSVLEDDVKVSGSLHLGRDSVAKGNLVAGRDIHLGADSQFHGVLHAGEYMWLGAGTRGGREGGLVAAFAARVLYVGDNVVINEGKLAAGEYVIAAAAKTQSDRPTPAQVAGA